MNHTAAPLVVDLDGTLTPTDTLIESIIALVKCHALYALRLPFWLLMGRATFKASIASRVDFAAEQLPYRKPFLEYLSSEKQNGRHIILATAAHRLIAEAVARHLGLFDAVLASDGTRNLKGEAKLKAITEMIGDRFVYAGDSVADLPIWRAAEGAILVGASSQTTTAVRLTQPDALEFPGESAGLKIWLRALRVHQWLKNLLLLVPLLTAFSFWDIDKLATLALAILAFSLVASGTYLFNDLWDLEADRAHPRKRNRPIASSRIKIPTAVAVGSGTLIAGLLVAAVVSAPFLRMLLLYLLLTSAYSWVLKEYVLLDVLALSVLYTLRILAGSVATAIDTSSWLLAFSVFLFFSLALVKRCSELVALEQLGRDFASGRDYRVTDLVVLWPLGVGAALCAVVVFGLYINAPQAQVHYATPQLLWFVALGLVYWLSRLWIKSARGEMHDDPVVFAIRDFGSRLTLLAVFGTTLTAHFLALGTPLTWTPRLHPPPRPSRACAEG